MRRWIGATLMELEPGAPVSRLDRVAYVSGDLLIESVTTFSTPTATCTTANSCCGPSGQSNARGVAGDALRVRFDYAGRR